MRSSTKWLMAAGLAGAFILVIGTSVGTNRIKAKIRAGGMREAVVPASCLDGTSGPGFLANS
jgi:hypothetical protein